MKKSTVSVLLALVVALAVPFAAQAQEQSIVDIAVADGRFTTLVAAVQAAGLADTLAGEGPFTVFAPTDDAFAALPEGTVEALLADIPALTDILLYHVVSGTAMAADVAGLDAVETLNGLPVDITVTEDGNVFLNEDVQVIITDIEASNGVIHVIDAVLVPGFNVRNPGPYNLNFRAGPSLESTIIGSFQAGERAFAEGRNEAGDWVQITRDGATGWVFAPLVELSGAIDELPVIRNIVEIAVADGRFTTLVAAVEAAGLAGALSGEGPLTVFAPTDDAFAALPEGTVEALLADIPALTDILLYHVVAGKAMAADVVNLTSVETLNGKAISITVNDQGVFLNDTVQVIITDIEASNGVIHVIDAVLLPPEGNGEELGTIVDIAAGDARFSTLVTAVQAAGLVDALSGAGPFTVFAPTDDAFAALPEGTVEALLADIPTLSNILLYHVVSGKAMAADVLNLETVTTLEGANITITVEDGNVFLNGSVQVIITDIEASNGVIHVIDAVLLPPSM